MTMAAGGGAFISAAHLAHAGRAVALVARLGFDGLSRGIEPDLRIDGVDLRFLERTDDAGPQVTVASVIGNDRAFLSRRAGSALPATLSAALQWKDARHLHIAEFATLHEIPDLVRQAKAAGLSVSLDPSWDETLIYDSGLLSACEGVDIFLPNREEAQAITGHGDPAKALDALAGHFPVVALKGAARARGCAPPMPISIWRQRTCRSSIRRERATPSMPASSIPGSKVTTLIGRLQPVSNMAASPCRRWAALPSCVRRSVSRGDAFGQAWTGHFHVGCFLTACKKRKKAGKSKLFHLRSPSELPKRLSRLGQAAGLQSGD